MVYMIDIENLIILNVLIMMSRVTNQILKGATAVNISDKHTYSVQIAMP